MEIKPLPYTASMGDYERQAIELLNAYSSGDAAATNFLWCYSKRMQQIPENERPNAPATIDDTRQAILNWFRFDNWQQLEAWVSAVTKPGSPAAQFELATDAIVTGDIATLQSLLTNNPELIQMRSVRPHRSMLIHFVGSNGVEDYRQKCPANIVEVLHVLLKAGADINAVADMYGGGSTPIGLASTSFHPAKAGLMSPLLDALLKAGAIIDSPEAIKKGYYAINGCLANGRPEAADFLMRHGAQLDLEGAIGTGRLDIVKTFFKDGSLEDPAMKNKMERGYMWACEFGHTAVIEFLLDNGLDPNVNVHGMLGLHWALIGGHTDTIQLLLDRKVSLEDRNVYGGTALGAGMWAVAHSSGVYRWPQTDVDYVQIIGMLLDAGSVIEPWVLPWLVKEESIPADLRNGIADLLRNHTSS